MPDCINEWASEYRRRGLAICRLKPGEKNPTYKKWTLSSLSAKDFGPADSIGVISGRLSDDLVCLDIDCPRALEDADHFLPGTRMEEGRPGKPRSHRWFKVADIPASWTANCAGGMGGPRTTQFSRGRGPGQMVVEFRGTGSQAVVPASIWTSKDGSKREMRLWHSFREPAVVGCLELLGAVARFATAFGGRNSRWEASNRARSPRLPQKKEVGVPDLLPLPTGEAAEKARGYLRKVPPAVEGQGGDHRTFSVACLLVRDFALSIEEAFPLLVEWNSTCLPPWPVEALLYKLECAAALKGPRGGKLRPRSSRTIEVNIRPGDREVIVGVDCARECGSYVNLQPDLWAALVRHDHTFRLVPELESIDWTEKVVTLATPSNVATNMKIVYDEFKLAFLLRGCGAEVKALRIALPSGRRLTLADAEKVETTIPPWTAAEVEAAAKAASKKALEQERVRRSSSRNKSSPAVEKAVVWLRNQNVEEVTKELVKKARRHRVRERTLQRAFEVIRQEKRSA